MAQTPGQKNKKSAIRQRLTFRRALNDLVLLLCMLEDTLRAEHFLIDSTVEFDLFLRMSLAVLDY